ncbi:thiamine diphosphokinase [Streptococcus hongkongensis]|nr:thiamine pyrophosphokinase [Streptococcus uberis]
MTKIALFAGGELSYYQTDFDLFVGIDRGNLFLLKHALPIEIAVGDFDSVSPQEFTNIKEKAKKVIRSSAEKNDTDTELALKTVFAQYPDAQVTIFGAFGGRLDHLMSNIFLPSDPEIAPFMMQITLRDQQNSVSYKPCGSHIIDADPEMTYVAFMADADQDLTISGAKYDLNSSNFFKKKMYSSNEFSGHPIEVTISSGYLIVIQSKDGR